MVAAFAEHAAEGPSAFRFDGGRVDTPHLARAHRVLARAGTTDPSPAAPSG